MVLRTLVSHDELRQAIRGWLIRHCGSDLGLEIDFEVIGAAGGDAPNWRPHGRRHNEVISAEFPVRTAQVRAAVEWALSTFDLLEEPDELDRLTL